MTNFNPYTGNKKPYGQKKKPVGKKAPYVSKGKGKLKMAEGGEVVEEPGLWDKGVQAIKDYVGIGHGLRGKQIDAQVDAATSGTTKPKKKKN